MSNKNAIVPIGVSQSNPAVQTALRKLAVLRQRAEAGDPKARAELLKVQAGLARLNMPQSVPQPQRVIVHDPDADVYTREQRAQLARIDALAPSGEETVSGEPAPDNDTLELADEIAREHPTADELAHRAHLRAHQWRGLADVAKFVRTAPPSILQGTLGNQAPFVPKTTGTAQTNGGLAQQPLTPVAMWAGVDSETSPWTVVFGLTGLAGVTPTGVLPVGIVQFGTRGALLSFEVDIGVGTQFTVYASQINLATTLEVSPVGGGGTLPAGYQIGLIGTLTPGVCAKPARVTRTRAFSPGTIPSFAVDFYIPGVAAVGGLSVSFKDSSGTEVGTFALAAGASMNGPLPLPRWATQYSFTGATTVAGYFGLQFGLGF